MHMCPDPGWQRHGRRHLGRKLLVIDDAGVREVATGLPFVTSVELAA